MEEFIAETSLPLLHGYVMLRIGWANVIGSRADQPIVLKLLDDMGGPTAYARNGEHGRKQIDVDAKSVIGRSGIEIYVGIEFLVRLHELFNLLGCLKPFCLPTGLAEVA